MAAPRDFDPGAATYGNFINYYSFNPAENRIKNIPKTFLHDLQLEENTITCLDVGCNSGELTVELYRHISHNDATDLQFLGIDMDPVLIERCKELNKFPKNINYNQIDFMDHENREKQLRIYLQSYNTEKFHIIFAFSITMWIHINFGDDGLCEFLTQLSKWANFLLIEPQPWKCYRQASRRMKRGSSTEIFEQFKYKLNNLKIREEIEDKIINYLTEKCQMQIMNEYDKTKWNRRMILFKSKAITN